MSAIKNEIVPEEFRGKQTELTASRIFNKREEATNAFTRACKRLLNPAIWHELCGTLSPDFNLVDKNGNDLHRLAEVGDYIQIKLPAPGNAAGDGYDWVMVDMVEDRSVHDGDAESFGLRIRPSTNPTDNNKDAAHFFEDSATGSYIIERHQNTVNSLYYGRNEVPNTSTEKTTDNIRNTIVAGVGLAGISEVQWKTFLNKLLEPEIGG